MKNFRIFFLIATPLFFLISCSVNQAKIDTKLKKYFDTRNVDGTFTILDNAKGGITVYNMELDTMRFSPGATFQIITSLVGLENGEISNDSMVVKWDGVRRENKEWNKNLIFKDAFKLNSDPYFNYIANKITRDTLKMWVDSISYGNKNLNENVDSILSVNSVKISADEQLGLVKKLYFDQLPFRKSAQQSIRDAMLMEDNTNYKLSYKTGSAVDENNLPIGWVIGWIEENRHVYFFATLVKGKQAEEKLNDAGMNVTRDILKDLGFFEGKK